MKRLAIGILGLLLAAVLPLAAQDNPYEIDNECYTYYQQAELYLTEVDTDRFERANAKLLELARAKGDEKARTLYYVEALKRASRVGRAAPESERKRHNAAVDAAQEKLMAVAKETGYIQYYYYAFDVAQTYYYNTGQSIRAFDLLNEMIRLSEESGDDYGMWQAVRFLAILYQNQGDLLSTRRYLKRGLEIFENTKNATLRKQTVTRMYCDLADTYDIGTDSARIFYNRAWDSAKQDLDTLRCTFYDALQAAFDDKQPAYRQARDFCLAHPSFQSLFPTGATCFRAVDDIVARREPPQATLDSIHVIKQRHFLGRLAYKNELLNSAYYLTYAEASNTQSRLSSANEARLDELTSRWERSRMTSELEQKSQQVTRITRLVMILLIAFLLAGLFFSWLHVRNLRQDQKRDEKRIEELKQANEKVRLADAAKTRFVQNMSHEVRTPLNAIVGFSQLLSLPDGSFPEEEKEEFASHIVNNSKMLTMLLDDILSTSSMDSGNYRINYEDGEVNYICEAAISSAEHRLQPGVTMRYAPEGDGAPLHFRTDPRRVQQILINLLTNACKHTAKGEIVLSSSLTALPGFVRFAVTDTGTGVPADQAEAIFNRFTKLNEFVQGTGLGLSICRDIAGRMGAKVYLDTTYTAGGARFILDVPTDPDGGQCHPDGGQCHPEQSEGSGHSGPAQDRHSGLDPESPDKQ